MFNCLILGAGRSGTSMVASLFRNTGAYMGENLIDATPANPLGYYECRRINELNNRLIDQLLEWPKFNRLIRQRIAPPAHRDRRCYWLAAPRRLRKIQPLPGDLAQMERHTRQTPFCLKDPRFNLTLPTWRPQLPADTRFLVVFRDPTTTVESILRHAREDYSPPLPITRAWAYTSWARHYQFVLGQAKSQRDWLFVHYDQVADGEELSTLEAFVEASFDETAIDRSVSRSQRNATPASQAPLNCRRVYEQLLRRSQLSVASQKR